MKGMELARAYYLEYGAPMIHEQFPEYEGIVAVGLTGPGSECYGFDDEISRDHDFEPGFCLFLPGEDVVDRRAAFLMERAYAKLPKEYRGFRRQPMAPVGGNRHGVIRITEFFERQIGCMPDEMDARQWLQLEECVLAEAVNGEIFRDDSGLMTDARKLLALMPEDIRKKRLAGHLLLMGQSGQYNYPRCLRHGETGAAQLAVFEFAHHAMAAWFLLKGGCMPYYKWAFRALRELPGGGELAGSMERLISIGNEGEDSEEKIRTMEETAEKVLMELQAQGLTDAVCGDLEKHAYSVNDRISDGTVRNWHILCAAL